MPRPLRSEQVGTSPVVALRAPSELVALIDEVVEATGLSRAEVLRDALTSGLQYRLECAPS